jgi:hypothetical protein
MGRCALHQPDQGPRTPLVHAILASPAMCLVDLKAEWGETRQPLRESVRNYPDNELTNIRDKGCFGRGGRLQRIFERSPNLCREARRIGLLASQITRRKGELIRFYMAQQKILKVKVTKSKLRAYVGAL